MSDTSQLKRDIGLFSAIAVVVANMVGTGIFTTSGYILQELGSTSALLFGWVMGGVFALCGALCYGELGARFPEAGGEYIYLREAFGRPLAFLSGWISLIVGFSAPIAAGAIAFASYLLGAFGLDQALLPTFAAPGMPMFALSVPVILAVAIVLLLSLLHVHSLRVGSRIQNLLTVFKVALVAVFIGAGLSSNGGSMDHFRGAFVVGDLLDTRFAVALIFISFAYSGWNAVAYLGGEIKRPSRNIPLAMLAGTLVVTALYLMLNVVYIYALPQEQMRGVMEVAAVAGVRLFGPGIGRWFNGAIAFGLLSVLSAMILAGPRVYYAMSRDGIFFPFFGKVNSVRRTPAHAIGLQAAIAIAMILSASYDKLLIYIGFTLSLFAMLTVIGLMWLRYKDAGQALSYRTWGYPFTPMVFIAANAWIIYFSVSSRPAPVIWGLVTIVSGIGAYAYFHHSRKKQNLSPSESCSPVSDGGEIRTLIKEDLS